MRAINTNLEEVWISIKAAVDAIWQPILILDEDFCVVLGNRIFYRTFGVRSEDTEHSILFELGNGQWDIPDLRRLLRDILPEDFSFAGFEVVHEFPVIGNRIIVLSARRIHSLPVILLVMEDVTEKELGP